ncbi:magnesium transporter [Hydrogenimonas cancrithermarum]|uniref:Magnesium transporter MgtE n=1 Tax=Hydrogenimonas cancrithermarum TaxID=2993563 RepID=A0ABM8FHH8_9BACT|nr:magnesium transporter [Hydrogenimonas cancrithermarum]BDY11725.1 magnesium transporter MgtE [Hydrogenimonas cancrithermarum]
MQRNIDELCIEIERRIKLFQEGMDENAHAYEIAELLEEVREQSKPRFIELLKSFPEDLKADVLAELSKSAQEDALEAIDAKELAEIIEEMDTDDAADIVQQIEEIDEVKAGEVLDEIDEEESKVIRELISYDEDEAGAYMQTELFKAYIDETIGESIKRLKEIKKVSGLDNAYHVFIVDNKDRFLGMMPMEDLVLHGPNEIYRNIIDREGALTVSIRPQDPIDKVIELAGNYNMNVIPVVDEWGILLGRITADDIYDLMEKQATDQIYGMAGVQEESEESENIIKAGKTRAFWLGINLVTAIAASVVIGFFDSTIQSIVALAVLMPIVASMGGNAGTQSLTVTVRQLALGDIDPTEAKRVITKEVLLSLGNGLIYAVVMGLIAYTWFDMPMLGVVIGLSMVINLIAAGFFGAMIPLVLKGLGIDPAVGSSVLLTTVTDVVGFFSFLGLATLILL